MSRHAGAFWHSKQPLVVFYEWNSQLPSMLSKLN